MSTTPSSAFQPGGPGAYQTGGTPPGSWAPEPAAKPRNTVAIVAFVAAVIGFVFAVWEGAYLIGWILLPIAFVLSIVALVGSDKPKKLAVWALVLSIVGTIAGAFAFMASTARIIDDAIGESTSTVVASTPQAETGEPGEETTVPSEAPSTDTATPQATSEPIASGLGTREQPLPLGTTIGTDEWQVTVNSFTADATEAVLGENQFNDPPAEGNTYALVNVTLTRVAAEAATPFGVQVSYITAGGNVVTTTDAMVVAPEALGFDELYGGASVTGNVVLEIPAGDAGVLRVEPGFLADEAFVATS